MFASRPQSPNRVSADGLRGKVNTLFRFIQIYSPFYKNYLSDIDTAKIRLRTPFLERNIERVYHSFPA